MIPEPTQTIANTADPGEPASPGAVVPVWLLILMVLLLYGGAVYFDQHGGWFDSRVYAPYRSAAELQKYQPRTEGLDLERGRVVFETVCALCHGVDGAGKPGQAPPLVGSDWVLGNPNRMIRIPLYGLSGPIRVKDQDWNLAMPAMGAALPPNDLAAVLTYIRTSWGNKASAITPEQIQGVKAQVGNRAQPFTAADLNAVQ
jgi:mono/diheme cytochrome c family protein